MLIPVSLISLACMTDFKMGERGGKIRWGTRGGGAQLD